MTKGERTNSQWPPLVGESGLGLDFTYITGDLQTYSTESLVVGKQEHCLKLCSTDTQSNVVHTNNLD